MDRDLSQRKLDERTRRDLTRLADSSLEGFPRAELEARLAGSASLRAALERQRAGAAALRGLELQAPASLRVRISANAASSGPRVTRHPKRRSRRLAFGGGLTAALAAGALAAVLILPTGAGSPSVSDAARLAERPSTAAVGIDPSNSKLLAANVEGVPFPNWSTEFGWRQVGTRSDPLADRQATTVLYEHDGKRLAYTIVSGHGIAAPSDASTTRRNGVNLHAFGDRGRRVVTWWRDGRTCVLSGSGVGDRELLKLASWKGDGAVSF
jgi:anti-sigma factor RsiW